MSVNFKFLIKLIVDCHLNSTCLLRLWLKQLFKIPLVQGTNVEQKYFFDFVSQSQNILDFKFKLPRKNNWSGHPYYYEVLKYYETSNFQNLLKIFYLCLWFNKHLNTTFNVQLSKAGYNHIKDLYNNGQPYDVHQLSLNLNIIQINSLKRLYDKIQQFLKNTSDKNIGKCSTIFPFQTINYEGTDYHLFNINSKQLIFNKVKLPTDLLNWCDELELSDEQIKTAFLFAHNCCTNIFHRVFQYKIVTQILPANEYLQRYKVKDTNICEKCLIERDTIVHRLYECELVVPVVNQFLSLLQNECEQTINITMITFLFGIPGNDYNALNQILLELKKSIFYSCTEELSSNAFNYQRKTYDF